ncbi:MAG: NAD(+)/NADH kinase [Candidatus Lernaella stagnicola]|nr:NAD(+)/NADH kinase [Candidatus Lernaella stagnicola]
MGIEKVAVFIKRNKSEAGTLAKHVIRWISRRGLTPLVPENEAKMYNIGEGQPTEQVFNECDMVIVLGGDGTFLAAARLLGGRQAPIMGVNLGSMGFLTEIRRDEVQESLDLVLAEKATIIRRMRLQVDIVTDGETSSYSALNDVVITKTALARIYDLRIAVGGIYMNIVRADGLIISTPTGSTAYNLAAGGPIVHPQTNCLVVTPICPHMLSNRPLVVPADQKIELELVDDAEVFVTIDGQAGQELNMGDRVVTELSEQPLLVIQSPKRTYFELLRDKLHYGAR